MIILANVFQEFEEFIQGIVGIILLALFVLLLVAIIFGGIISTVVGSIMGSALNRTIAEQEYLQQNEGQKNPQSPYHVEGLTTKLERPAFRGFGFQVLFTLFGAGTLYIIVLVFVEHRFEAPEAFSCIFASLFSAAAIYNLRQTKRQRALPEELFSQGRFRLYLTWFYLCLFTNVVIAGLVGLWALALTALISIGGFIYPNLKPSISEHASSSVNQNDHP